MFLATSRNTACRRFLSMAMMAFISYVSGSSLAQAQGSDTPSCQIPMALLTSLQGQVEFRNTKMAIWQRASLHQPLCGGDELRTGALSRAQLQIRQHSARSLRDGTLLQINARSSLVLPSHAQPWWLTLWYGALHILTRTPDRLTVKTPVCNANVEGTEFLVKTSSRSTEVNVYEGAVKVDNAFGSIRLSPGEAALTEANRAPQRLLLLKPRDAVQWALYYPPLLDTRTVPAGPNASLYGRVFTLYHQGKIPDAMALLDSVPASMRDAYYPLLRAALHLSVGQVDSAKDDLATVKHMKPGDPIVLSLESIIALANNQKTEALRWAQEAVRSAPADPTPHVAESYALQASFQLEDAQRSAQKAVDVNPNNGLAWTRLAEVELALGQKRQAATAIQRARDIDPGIARTHTLAGYAALARIDVRQAEAAFRSAIELDSADPLSRLGLGLAKIRKGDLQEGRREMETAVNLDPNNALLRSYLGKAYFEEKRNDLAAKELATAKYLDPLDPTPWFYDGILEQSINRPIDALRDLQTSIRLNDNRAVYRSRLALDEDRAMRGATLARTFDTLNFKRRALVESTRSLAEDPTDYSAHRFLSDTYVNQPRYQIAQVSELLQAQLLQPLNIQPVQPLQSVTRLDLSSLRTGPAQAAYNEFTSYFERNRPRFLLSGQAGTNDTFGDEAILSGIHDNVSYSFGQSHYQTEGFRPLNADIEHNVYNAFVQAELNEHLNAQFEYRRRESHQGVTNLDLDPESPLTNRYRLTQDIWRMGTHLTLTPAHHVLGSAFFTTKSEPQSQEIVDDSHQIRETRDRRNAYSIEGQYLFRSDSVDLVLGGGTYKVDVSQVFADYLPSDACLKSPIRTLCLDTLKRRLPSVGDYSATVHQDSTYAYLNLKPIETLTATLGLSYDAYDQTSDARTSTALRLLAPRSRSRLSPKLGLQWQIRPWARLRSVYMHTLKRQLVVDQTIEPTQVAGFNQLYDDFNGTYAKVHGAAMDFQWGPPLYAGIQYMHRSLNNLQSSVNGREDSYNAYLHWIPGNNWSVNAELQIDDFYQQTKSAQATSQTRLSTTSLPITARYFAPRGLFGEVGTTVVWQKLSNTDSENGTTNYPQNSFALVNAAIGYRLPARWGIVSLEVKNLLDKQFSYQDLFFRTSDSFEVVTPFLPGRTVLARFTLSF